MGSRPGSGALNPIGADAEIDHLWVAPAWMGQGLGRLLFRAAVVAARQANATGLVIESDPHAEGFYRQMGAGHIGERRYKLEDQERVLPLLRYDLARAP